ncbi:MAG TPA: PQQ-dependent sugar dehydrogenase [Phycisphaerales bacterium]|nr:PQQ-dependent sugar dehydrogenase [Phycisphaerales bacterium]
MRFLKAAAILAACCAAVGAMNQAAQAQYRAERVVSGLTLPLFVTAPKNDFSRIFIIEQRSGTTGRIRLANLPSYSLNATPYLSVSPVTTGNEQGLLGLAFHPDFLNNGYFWVYYTASNSANTLARYQANAPFATSTTANAGSARTLFAISDPFSNHNGGWIGFGPDNMLYIAMGDSGSANDPNGNGQNINTMFGKMHRIDVDGVDNIPGNDDDDGVIGSDLAPYTSPPDNPFAGAIAGRDEIWHYGLRNPWRDSFDRVTGAMYIGDVGQDAVEEVDYVAPNTPGTMPGDSGYQGGKNFGWRCMEGNNCTGLSGCTCGSAALTNPIWPYAQGASNCSVIGGYVYRGCAIPSLQGNYFFADYCSNSIWTFAYSGSGTVSSVTARQGDLAPGGGLSVTSITSFGEDAYGELYIVDQGGEIYKVKTDAAPGFEGPDCNTNSKPDCDDIMDGTSQDVNTNGVPDECEVRACCLPSGDCQDLKPSACTTAGGVSSPLGTLCVSNPCAPANEACCFADGSCQELTSAACITAGGTPQGSGTTCATANCPLPACYGDANGDRRIGLADIAVIIQGWAQTVPPGSGGDLDGSGDIGLGDIAKVIQHWACCCGGANPACGQPGDVTGGTCNNP